MLVDKELSESSPEKDALLTIGVFDGVHLGHRYLISQLTERARQQNLLSCVVTFNQHPRAVLSPDTSLPYLTDVNEKVRLLRNAGVDAVVVLTFDSELAQLSADQFIGLLKKHRKMRGLIIGPDFTLGRDRGGDINRLRQLGTDMDFSLTMITPVMVNSEVVSSTAIRNALADGNMPRVARLLGRLFRLQGEVTSGAGRGTKLGFPTANLALEPKQALPEDGVYATWSYIDDKTYQSMTNIGQRPTFNGKERIVETYILDYHGNLYGRELIIDIVERLRSEQRFDNVEELKKQMREDVEQGRLILQNWQNKEFEK